MKTNYLFPHKFRLIGWILFIPSAVLGFMIMFNDFEFSFLNIKTLSLFPTPFLSTGTRETWSIINDNFSNELAGILLIVSAIFIAFSKEKKEDEYIAKIRLESLLWATYITFAIHIFCMLFFYDLTYLTSMIINMFTLLIVFIVRYNFIIYRSKYISNEE